MNAFTQITPVYQYLYPECQDSAQAGLQIIAIAQDAGSRKQITSTMSNFKSRAGHVTNGGSSFPPASITDVSRMRKARW